MDELQSQIETRIADLDPAIEVLDVQRIGREDLRIFIDHPSTTARRPPSSFAICSWTTAWRSPRRVSTAR